jgi:hypothetical protein
VQGQALTVSALGALAPAPAAHHWNWLMPLATTPGSPVCGPLVYTWAPDPIALAAGRHPHYDREARWMV